MNRIPPFSWHTKNSLEMLIVNYIMITSYTHTDLDTPDNDTLVLLPPLHEVVGVVSDGKDVRRLISNLLVPVLLDMCSIVDG